MNLPDLAWQFAYSRIAWGVVLASIAVCFAFRGRAHSRTAVAWLTGAVAAAQWLPGPASPAYWLGQAFQSPSGMTTALCAVVLRNQWTGHDLGSSLSPALASVLAAAGALLYLDASGWIAYGIYYNGFGPVGAPVAALLLGVVCAWALARGAALATAFAVFAAVSLFMLLRLPTGNLWDAVLDPFLWVWSLVVCTRALRRWRRQRIEPLGATP